jgi:acetylornithine deacetylase/succinyl-diaminopimelate desuccinylase-like protein
MTKKGEFTEIAAYVHDRVRSPEYRDFLSNLLCDLVNIDTTTSNRKLTDIVSGEHRAFEKLENAIKSFSGPQMTLEHTPINPEIGEHPYYTRAYYTATEKNPQGLPAAESYRNRFNLLAMVKPEPANSKGRPVILNAHIDTVSPFFPCKKDEKFIHGRGACDDKGSIVMLAAALKLQLEIQAKFGPLPAQPTVYQFVIEEEPGGNGSLSAALDPRFKGYEAIICECTGNIPYPANRGAMWFQMDVDAGKGLAAPQMVPFILYELAREGRQLREETNLPLFPKDYVQVNLGSLGTFGRHPSAVNDYIAYEIKIGEKEKACGPELTSELHKVIAAAVSSYCRNYKDRTIETNPETKKPKLKKHYELTEISARHYRLEIFGVGGHMGAMLLCDNALIKAGFILSEVIPALRSQCNQVEFCLAEQNPDPTKLILTGGVGFTPTHRMPDLQVRLRNAAQRGLDRYNELTKSSVSDKTIRLTFDKLHNDAYASPTDSPGMKAFEQVYKSMNLSWPKPVAWRASCDARIYGNHNYNTIVCGPGDLADAHSDHERITVAQMQEGLELIALTTLLLTTGG